MVLVLAAAASVCPVVDLNLVCGGLDSDKRVNKVSSTGTIMPPYQFTPLRQQKPNLLQQIPAQAYRCGSPNSASAASLSAHFSNKSPQQKSTRRPVRVEN